MMGIKRISSWVVVACAVVACLGGSIATAQERDDYGFFRPTFGGVGLWRAQINAGGNPPDIDGNTGDFQLAGLFGNNSANDIALMGDVNGDDVDDRVIYNTGTNQWIWDSAPISGGMVMGGFGDGVAEAPPSAFGLAGDIALLGDINGDGPADRVLFRPSTETWHVDFSIFNGGYGDGVEEVMGGSAFYDGGGQTIHRVALADYNGDGVDDRVVFSAGQFLQIPNPGGAAWSASSPVDSVGVGLGNASFVPPPYIGDFDGDGKSENIAWASSTVFARLSTTVPPWHEPPTVTGNHWGDPSQDTSFFLGNLDHAPVPVIPEPATVTLALVAAALVGIRRKRSTTSLG